MGEKEPLEVIVARIETKLDTALSKQGDHEKRLRTLEKAYYTLLGLSVAFPVILKYLIK